MATIENYYMRPETVSKNEYIALELVKAWCGQQGVPAPATTVLDRYKYFRDELNREVGENDKT